MEIQFLQSFFFLKMYLMSGIRLIIFIVYISDINGKIKSCESLNGDYNDDISISVIDTDIEIYYDNTLCNGKCIPNIDVNIGGTVTFTDKNGDIITFEYDSGVIIFNENVTYELIAPNFDVTGLYLINHIPVGTVKQDGYKLTFYYNKGINQFLNLEYVNGIINNKGVGLLYFDNNKNGDGYISTFMFDDRNNVFHSWSNGADNWEKGIHQYIYYIFNIYSRCENNILI